MLINGFWPDRKSLSPASTLVTMPRNARSGAKRATNNTCVADFERFRMQTFGNVWAIRERGSRADSPRRDAYWLASSSLLRGLVEPPIRRVFGPPTAEPQAVECQRLAARRFGRGRLWRRPKTGIVMTCRRERLALLNRALPGRVSRRRRALICQPRRSGLGHRFRRSERRFPRVPS